MIQAVHSLVCEVQSSYTVMNVIIRYSEKKLCLCLRAAFGSAKHTKIHDTKYTFLPEVKATLKFNIPHRTLVQVRF